MGIKEITIEYTDSTSEKFNVYIDGYKVYDNNIRITTDKNTIIIPFFNVKKIRISQR